MGDGVWGELGVEVGEYGFAEAGADVTYSFVGLEGGIIAG